MRPTIRLARDSDIEAIASLVARYWEFENIPGFERSRTVKLLAGFLAQSERGHCWASRTLSMGLAAVGPHILS